MQDGLLFEQLLPSTCGPCPGTIQSGEYCSAPPSLDACHICPSWPHRHSVSSLSQVNPTPAGPSSSMRSLNPALPADPRLTSALNIISLVNIWNLFIYSFVSLNMADDISATGMRYQVLPYSSVCAPVRIMSNCYKILNVLSMSNCCIGSWAHPLINAQGLELILNEQLLQDLELGPAVAPYPPPAPTYPEARDSLIDNEVGLFLLQISSVPVFSFCLGKKCVGTNFGLKCKRLAHTHILVFEQLVYHLLFFNYSVFQLLRIPNTV